MEIKRNNKSGHGYMLISTSRGEKPLRVDKNVAEYLLKNQDNVLFDIHSNQYTMKYNNVHTTLARFIYTKFGKKKIKKDSNVLMKNDIPYDFRLENLALKKEKNEANPRV